MLTAEPGSACARSGAKETQGDFWSWLGTALKNLGNALAAIALAVIAVVVLGWLLLSILTNAPGVRHLPGIRLFRRVRVQVTTLDDTGAEGHYGAGTTGALRANVVRDANDARVDLASGASSAAVALDGLAEASDQTKLAVALLKLAQTTLPDRNWIVTGELQAPGDLGEGLSLAIDNSGKFVDFGDFWRAQHAGPGNPSGSEAYRRLALPAGAWLGHHVAKANDPATLLSADPRSWALFQTGLHWQDQGDRSTARAFYERALGFDGDNIAALANLGVMDAEDGEFERAAERLERAIDLLEKG